MADEQTPQTPAQPEEQHPTVPQSDPQGSPASSSDTSGSSAETAESSSTSGGPTQTGESLDLADTGAGPTVSDQPPGQLPDAEDNGPAVTAEQNQQDLGPNPPPVPAGVDMDALRDRDQEALAESDAPQATSETPAEELPPGIAVGGSRIRPGEGPGPEQPAPDVAKAPGTVIAQPVRVDGRNRRNDGDALEGHWVKVTGTGISGAEHDHELAAFLSVAEYSQETGYPEKAVVRFKDTSYHTAVDVVDYADLEHVPIEKATA